LFLDEIGEMPLALQAKILRVVEDMKVHRLGAMTDRLVDVRIVAASHRELLTLAEQGRFRQDLYYRLSTLQIRIPPLRERKQEIPLLAQRFADLTANAAGRTVPAFTAAAFDALASYAWPGNIRELRNVVSQAVVFTESGRIDAEHLGVVTASNAAVTTSSAAPPTPVLIPAAPVTRAAPAAPAALAVTATIENVVSLDEQLRRMERERILEVLAACGNNQTRAAEQLGLPRRTFISRMAALGIPGRRSRPSGDKAPPSVEPDTLPSPEAPGKNDSGS
jgi:DNA-binding NtrC family response regulator